MHPKDTPAAVAAAMPTARVIETTGEGPVISSTIWPDGPPAPPSTMHVAQLSRAFRARLEGTVAATTVGRLAASYDRARLTPALVASALNVPQHLRVGPKS